MVQSTHHLVASAATEPPLAAMELELELELTTKSMLNTDRDVELRQGSEAKHSNVNATNPTHHLPPLPLPLPRLRIPGRAGDGGALSPLRLAGEVAVLHIQ